jgi:hypothetical protein
VVKERNSHQQRCRPIYVRAYSMCPAVESPQFAVEIHQPMADLLLTQRAVCTPLSNGGVSSPHHIDSNPQTKQHFLKEHCMIAGREAWRPDCFRQPLKFARHPMVPNVDFTNLRHFTTGGSHTRHPQSESETTIAAKTFSRKEAYFH